MPHGVQGKNFLRHVAQSTRGRYLDSIRLFQPDEMRALLSAELATAIAVDRSGTLAADRFERLGALPWPSQMMHFDLDTYLPEDILTKVDRMSMAHSIESRVPLLDHEVVTFAASLPTHMKIAARRAEAGVEAGGGAHPSGRGAGAAQSRASACPSATGSADRSKDFVADTLQSPRARQRGYFRPRFVDRLVAEHLSGRRDHTSRLWPLLMFELWHRRYLDGSGNDRGQPAG